MSYGSISEEAHQTLAQAMNKIAVKVIVAKVEKILNVMKYKKTVLCYQVLSSKWLQAVFVTSNYLQHAKELQIKVAQGAKPGEGGQLPGTKVYP